MFKNYDNISKYYTPNNLNNLHKEPLSYKALDPVGGDKPFTEYNAKGELIGYTWYYGNTLNLEFNIDGEIIVEDGSIIYSQINQAPGKSTRGKIGQRCYNVKDLRSWTCTYIYQGTFTWTEDPEFTYPEVGQSIYLDATDYLKGKDIVVNIYDWRYRNIYSKTFNDITKIILPIDVELSKQLVKGVYYIELLVKTPETCEVVFNPKDCIFNVK